jgi:hypothetical protein
MGGTAVKESMDLSLDGTLWVAGWGGRRIFQKQEISAGK